MPIDSEDGSEFGRKLRHWRRVRGLSQLVLATEAESTPRHISFIETGRSRPGKDLILRIGEGLKLPLRARNDLLRAAGFPAVYPTQALAEEGMAPFRKIIERLLDGHTPYPAAAIDVRGGVQMCNDTFRRFLPGVAESTAEESIDRLFGAEGRKAIVNWADVAWAHADLRREQAERFGDAELQRLSERALGFLADTPRPLGRANHAFPALVTRTRVGQKVVSTVTTVVRFETAREVTASELRVELIFPADDQAEALFRSKPPKSLGKAAG